jgi:hypothetical protein
MVLDRATDSIAHFIGLFELKVDEFRLRDIYERFDAKQTEQELDPIQTVDVEIPNDYELLQGKDKPLPGTDPYEPGKVDLIPLDLPLPETHVDGFVWPDAPDSSPLVIPPIILIQRLEAPLPAPIYPGSMLTITIEKAWLWDNDVLGSGDFRDPAESETDLAALAAVAKILHAPWSFDPGELPTLETLQALASEVGSFWVPNGYSFDVQTLRGDAVPSHIMNGAEVEFLPSWSDLRPNYHQPEDDDEEEPIVPDWAFPREYVPNPEMPEGHKLVTGGNLLVNEAHLSIALVDAPLIAVGGSWMKIDLVSQVSAVSNHDVGTGARQAPSSVFQTVLIEETSNEAYWQADRDPTGDAPLVVQLSIIDGDLFISNYIEQYILMMDNDMFGMSISSANSAFILGDNTVFNATTLIELGFAYDLILVGGNFLTINSIYQTQVLLDDDLVNAALPLQFGTDDPLDGSKGDPTVCPGWIGGDPEVEDDANLAPDWDAAPDNLLMSEARLTTVGVDTRAEMSESLGALLAADDLDMEALRERLMNDPSLAGLEQARVLMIKGDLIQSNIINQTILASDRDDVRIDGNVPLDLELVTGTNALLNAASIATQGVDSVVMTTEEGYSDLLIHQARLIDEPDLSGVPSSDLAEEAVAFLMDDTLDGVAQQTETIGGSGDEVTTDHYDAISGVLV